MGFFLQVQEPFKGICCNAFAFINACIQATSFPTFKFDGKAASQVILLSTNTFTNSRSLEIYFPSYSNPSRRCEASVSMYFSQFLGLRIWKSFPFAKTKNWLQLRSS